MVLFETKSPSNSCLAIEVAFDRAIFVRTDVGKYRYECYRHVCKQSEQANSTDPVR